MNTKEATAYFWFGRDVEHSQYIWRVFISFTGATLEGQDRGLTGEHYYTITKVLRFSTNVDLVQIRNPWGKDEWKGAWSNYSDEMKSLNSRNRKKLGNEINDNSEFFMTKEDFFEYFQDVQIVRLSPESLNDATNKKSKLQG